MTEGAGRMRIVLVSLGTLGDVHPFVAVAIALAEAGHHPVLAAAEAVRPIAARHAIEFHPVRPDGAAVLDDTGMDEGQVARAVASDLRFIVDRVILPYADGTLADLAPLMAGADLVLCSSFSVLGRIAAAAAGRPVMSLLLQPMALFSADDPPVTPTGSAILLAIRRRLGAWAVRPLLAAARAATKGSLRPFAALRATAGAPPFAGNELVDGPLAVDRVLGLWSPELAGLPRDAGAHVELCGATFYDGGFGGGGVPDALARFLDAGTPPVIFTLGSIAIYAEDGFYAASAAAARSLGVRAVLLVGDDLVERHRHLAGGDVLVVGYAPHSAVFGRAAAVVHHGGAGTTAQAMRAGAPQLACPMFGDQFDNAARLERRGLALTLPQARYTADRTAAALSRLLYGPYAATARAVAGRVRQEDGAAAVAATVDRWASTTPTIRA